MDKQVLQSLLSWLLGATGVVVLVGFIYASLALLDQAELRSDAQVVGKIGTVRVGGELKRIAVATVKNKLQPLLEQDFVALDLSAIRHTIEAMPWVREVTVGRKYPDILTVHVTEQKAVARWNNDAYVNPWGEVFHAPQFSGSEALIQLQGPKVRAKQVLQSYSEMQRLLGKQVRRIREISQSAQGNTQMVLAEGTTVMLGRTHLTQRLMRLKKVLVAGAHARMTYIDLRYRKGMAIKLKQDGQHV